MDRQADDNPIRSLAVSCVSPGILVA